MKGSIAVRRRINSIIPGGLFALWLGVAIVTSLVGVLARLAVPHSQPRPGLDLVLDRVEEIAPNVRGVAVGEARPVRGVDPHGDIEPAEPRDPVPFAFIAGTAHGDLDASPPIAVSERLDPHAFQFAAGLFTGARTEALSAEVQPVVNIAPARKGKLGAYVPVTSAATPLGYHPDFAKLGGWSDWANEVAKRNTAGGFTSNLVWRPHGARRCSTTPDGKAMPLDAMLYLRRDSADPIEAAAADTRAFIEALKTIKASLGPNGYLAVYLGNLEQAGDGEAPLNQLPASVRTERILAVLKPLELAGVDEVVIDAVGPKTIGSIEADVAALVESRGFIVGYEGWAEKGKSEHWAKNPYATGWLMANWYTQRGQLYPSKVAGRLCTINAAILGRVPGVWATTKDQIVAFVADAKANGIDPHIDIYDATAKGITPAKGY